MAAALMESGHDYLCAQLSLFYWVREMVNISYYMENEIDEAG